MRVELTNALRKQIASLSETKHRKAFGLFKAEGSKCVADTIDYFDNEYLFATSQWIAEHAEIASRHSFTVVQRKDIERMSSLTTASEVIAVYRIPERSFDTEICKNQLVIALDSIQDPGNLGTIIRTADWFGIRHIICSKSTVDAYSPKVVQATMGAISRVNVHYCDLTDIIDNIPDTPVYGTFLDGNNIYHTPLTANGIIIMGNEGRGVSADVSSRVNRRLYIPCYPVGSETSESLNVATATAITVAEFRRQLF